MAKNVTITLPKQKDTKNYRKFGDDKILAWVYVNNADLALMGNPEAITLTVNPKA